MLIFSQKFKVAIGQTLKHNIWGFTIHEIRFDGKNGKNETMKETKFTSSNFFLKEKLVAFHVFNRLLITRFACDNVFSNGLDKRLLKPWLITHSFSNVIFLLHFLYFLYSTTCLGL